MHGYCNVALDEREGGLFIRFYLFIIIFFLGYYASYLSCSNFRLVGVFGNRESGGMSVDLWEK